MCNRERWSSTWTLFSSIGHDIGDQYLYELMGYVGAYRRDDCTPWESAYHAPEPEKTHPPELIRSHTSGLASSKAFLLSVCRASAKSVTLCSGSNM